MSGPARQEDVDDRLGLPFLARLIGPRLDAKETVESEAEAGDRPDFEEGSPARAPGMRRVILPCDRPHGTSSDSGWKAKPVGGGGSQAEWGSAGGQLAGTQGPVRQPRQVRLGG